MKTYLITDLNTGDSTWVTAESVTAALIIRANELRSTNGRTPHNPAYGMPLLPATAQASHYSEGNVMNVRLGNVTCRGRIENVVRT